MYVTRLMDSECLECQKSNFELNLFSTSTDNVIVRVSCV